MKPSRNKRIKSARKQRDREQEIFLKDVERREKREQEHEPACLDSSDANLEDGQYCYLCGMPWYNCLCCHC